MLKICLQFADKYRLYPVMIFVCVCLFLFYLTPFSRIPVTIGLIVFEQW